MNQMDEMNQTGGGRTSGPVGRDERGSKEDRKGMTEKGRQGVGKLEAGDRS
jgi:hypothetical protein